MALPLIARHIMDRIAPWTCYLSELRRVREQIHTERKALRELDDQQLRDIGISRDAALREAKRPARDVPASRRPTFDPNCTTAMPVANPLLMIRLG